MPVTPNLSQSPISSIKPESKKDTASIFQNSLLTAKDPKPVLHFTRYDYTVASILFFSFILFVWLYATNRKRLNQVISAFYVNRYANQLAREEISLGNRVSVFLSTLFVTTITLFILQVNQYYGFLLFQEGSFTFLFIGLIILVIYTGKMIVIRLLGFIFQVQKEALDYSTTVFLFGNTLGLFMMPIVICLSFARQVSPLIFIYSGFAILATFLCARLVRGLIIGINSTRVSRFYLFLYLCTLEILPFVVMMKLFFLKIN